MHSFTVIGAYWMYLKASAFLNRIVVFNNVCVKPYRRLILHPSRLAKNNIIFRFFGYFFYTWFNAYGFSVYAACVVHSIAFVKKTIKLIFYYSKVVFIFFYSWYSYFFWTLFRPFFTIFFFLFLEFRFFFLFLLEYVRYYKFFYFRYYYYSIIEAYYVSFRKFFIGSKFFRFFTREIGEDLEETPYNNSQDLEVDEISDYLSDFPAYQDFQSSFSTYEQGYEDSNLQNYIEDAHYYDFWISPKHTDLNSLPAKPNIEFFAENYFEEENDLSFQLFCIWTSPTLFDFRDYSTSTSPYFYKDKMDTTAVKPRDWYPLELTQPDDYEEDHLEYYMDSGHDESEVSETSSIIIIPFDSDRSRLSKFVKAYQKKLSHWHSFQINNNFSRIPSSLRYLPIPDASMPKTLDHWKVATKEVSKFFFNGDQHRLYGFKFDSYQDLELVWSRVSYEIDRNPRKFYDFLMDNKKSDVFDKLFFEKPTRRPIFFNFSIFNSLIPKFDKNFIRYMHDYFSGYTTLDQYSSNVFYSSRSYSTNIFFISYLLYIANTDYKTFSKKFWLLSQFNQFGEFSRAFGILSKYGKSYDNFLLEGSNLIRNPKFIEDIYAAQVSYRTSQNYSPPLTVEYWNEDDGMFLFLIPRRYRPDFKKWLRSYLKPNVGFGRLKKGKKKKKKWKKLNKNDVIQVLVAWCKKEVDILRWRFLNRGNRDHYFYRSYTKSDSLRVATYENILSVFLHDSYENIRHSTQRAYSAYRSYIFRNYKPGSIFFYYTDGEDSSVGIREREYYAQHRRRRSYFTYDQVIQGSVWSALNPLLDDFFYEVYYLNNNIFFPSAFEDHHYSDLFSDDHRDAGLDIYDEYIYVGGIKDFDRNSAEGAEDLIPSVDEYGDEDTDTLDAPDESNWRSDEYMDYASSADDGFALGEETGGENPVHYIERFWYNSDWFFFNEHVDNDEGFEEWEPDEFDSMYDLDHSVDRLFFGSLKREGHFPATDQRIFLGSLWDGSNIDKDLDYSKNFKEASANADSTALVPVTKVFDSGQNKSYFGHVKFLLLLCYRFFIYFIFAVRAGLLVLFFSNFDNPKYFKLLQMRAHYLRWYREYTLLFNYKSRLTNWVEFFESFQNPEIFQNYVYLNKKQIISEPHTFPFLNDPYGRFWFQYPFNNHIRDFSYYTAVNLLETDYSFADTAFSSKARAVHLDPEEQIDIYQTDTAHTEHGADLSGMGQYFESRVYSPANRFFSSDPVWDSAFFRKMYSIKIDKLASYPWYSDRTKIETVGSDFTYLDLIFVEDIPEDDEFIDEDADDEYPLYNYGTDFYNKYFEKTRYGSNLGPYVPGDGSLDGLVMEEVDWDIGSLVSFSSDDFNTHIEDFSETLDIYYAAVLDWGELMKDYTSYYVYSKLRKIVVTPYKYWEVYSNSSWLSLAANYGIWVLLLRNFFNISLFFAFGLYGFFALTRIAYYIFGDLFAFGLYGFVVFAITFFYLLFILRFFFKSVNDFYKSFDVEERLAVYAALFIFFYFYNLNGYIRNPAYYAWIDSGSDSTKLLLSNNFSADFRVMGTDWYPESGFQHRPELNNQGWLFYRMAPIRPRYFFEEQLHEQFAQVVNPDRQIHAYNFNLAPYPTYFNPYNIYNFIKFQIFNITNENFVGYTQYDRAFETPNVKANLESAQKALHRPQIINYLHMTTPDAKLMVRNEITQQGAISLSSATLYSYSAITIDRKKYNNVEFVNPVNQSSVWTPYSPVSAPSSTLPYDFRPKVITSLYHPDSTKFNTSVFSNYLNTTFNDELVKVNNIPLFMRRDAHNYKNQIDADGTYLESIKSSKYRRSAYMLFNKKFSGPINSVFERSLQTRWAQQKLFQRQLIFEYSDALRKYLFFFNPNKAKPIRDAYSLAFKDLVPYPEILGHSQNKISKVYRSEFFRSLTPRHKKLYSAILETENFESAQTLVNHLTYFPKSGFRYHFYFDAPDSARFPLGGFFFEEYAEKFNSVVGDIQESTAPEEAIPVPRNAKFYEDLKWPFLADQYAHEVRNFISNSRLERIDAISGLFADYINFKKIQYKSYYAGKPHQDDVKYINKLAQANRLRRSKILSSYFIAIKSANKQSISDYYRESFTFINPYKNKNFYSYSSFYSNLQGISAKSQNFKTKLFDPFYSQVQKDLSYRSSADDRIAVYNSELEYMKPVYDFEKRYNARIHKRRFINKNYTRFSFGWHEYWYIEASLWYIFLDFIIVRDIIENAVSVKSYTPENKFNYKFNKFSHNYRYRKFLEPNSRKAVISVNTLVEKKSSKKTYLYNYNNEQLRIKDSSFGGYWPPAYDDDQFTEPLPRYTYADKIGGVDRPPLKSDRFNFKKPHLFSRIRFEHWSALAKEPMPFERQRKPYFGISVKDESSSYFEGKYKPHEHDEFPYITTKHVLKSYIWFSTLQRSKIQYKKTGPKRAFPYNQRFIKLFKKTKQEISDYIDKFAGPLTADEWLEDKDQYVTRIPVSVLQFKVNSQEGSRALNKSAIRNNNVDVNYLRKKRISVFEKNVAARAKLKFFKKILQDKKKYKDFQDKSKKFSRYFKNLQVRTAYDTRGQRKILKHRDLARYREYFFHGIVRSDEEKGEADIILTRAKRRKQIVNTKLKKKNEKL
jgi:hypothetical protein